MPVGPLRSGADHHAVCCLEHHAVCCLDHHAVCCLDHHAVYCLDHHAVCCLDHYAVCCLDHHAVCCLHHHAVWCLIIMLSVVFFVPAIIMTSPSICVHRWSYKKKEENFGNYQQWNLRYTLTVTNFTLCLDFKQILSVNSLAGWLTDSHLNTSLVSWLTS